MKVGEKMCRGRHKMVHVPLAQFVNKRKKVGGGRGEEAAMV